MKNTAIMIGCGLAILAAACVTPPDKTKRGTTSRPVATHKAVTATPVTPTATVPDEFTISQQQGWMEQARQFYSLQQYDDADRACDRVLAMSVRGAVADEARTMKEKIKRLKK